MEEIIGIGKSKEHIIYCERCEDDSICNPNGVGCPRGSCEAEIVGFVEITKKYVITSEKQSILNYFKNKFIKEN